MVANCCRAAANALPAVLVAVRVDRQGQGLLALECGELLGRQQVVVEVAELPRALDPDVAGAQGVLQLGQGGNSRISGRGLPG